MLEQSLNAHQLSALLSGEAKSGVNGLIGYFDGERKVMTWQDVNSEGSVSDLISFKHDGCYLITGGLGGIGIAFASSILASSNNAKVVLTGRAKQLSPSQQQKLDVLGHKSRVSYLPMDLADFDAVQSVINGLDELNGVLHSAGMNQDSYIVQKTAQQFSEVLTPKVDGSVHLHKALAGKNVDFLALFSSVSSWLGNVGQADYATANGFMEAYAELATFSQNSSANLSQGNDNKNPLQLVSINWPLWQQGGMNIQADALAALEKRTGLSAIESSTGIGAFHHSLLFGLSNSMLLEGDADVLRTITDGKAVVKGVDLQQQQVTATASQQQTQPSNDLTALTLDWLKQQFSALLHLSISRIEVKAQMENYGMDSILAMNLTTNLEEFLGPLPKTLFFEYLTIADLADYLVENHQQRLQDVLAAQGNTDAASQTLIKQAPSKQASTKQATAEDLSLSLIHI